MTEKTKICDLDIKDKYKALLTYLWQSRRLVDCEKKFDGTPRKWGRKEFIPTIIISRSAIYEFLEKGVEKGWIQKVKFGFYNRYRLNRSLFEL